MLAREIGVFKTRPSGDGSDLHEALLDNLGQTGLHHLRCQLQARGCQ